MLDASPRKRAKVSAAPALGNAVVAAAAAMTAEPALLRNIVSFIPRPATDKNSTGTGESTAQPTLLLQTMTALCRAIPGLSGLVGPTNEAFWREMVLTHFNFETSGDTFNVEDWDGDWYDAGEGVDDECDDPAYAGWHRHPKNGPHREWSRAQSRKNKTDGGANARANSDTRDSDDDDVEESDSGEHSENEDQSEEGDEDNYPSEFLVDGLQYWSSLGAYFKPSAYGFIEKVQQDRSLIATLWPDHEDAFSLFCDLLLLPRFQSTDDIEWETWSDGQQLVYPCLLGRFPTKIVGRGFAMLKFCDFVPYFWTGNDRPVSKRWRGFDGPLPAIACKLRAKGRAETRADGVNSEEGTNEDDDDVDGDHSECEERTRQERSIFPRSESDDASHPFLHLRRFVYGTFSDWRRVHISQCEMASPEFYIGPTKRSGRWMGFVGQSDYLSYGREGDEEDY